MSLTQLDRVEVKLDDLIATVGERAISMESRVKALETNQANAGKIATWLSGIVAAIVTFVITQVTSAFHRP